MILPPQSQHVLAFSLAKLSISGTAEQISGPCSDGLVGLLYGTVGSWRMFQGTVSGSSSSVFLSHLQHSDSGEGQQGLLLKDLHCPAIKGRERKRCLFCTAPTASFLLSYPLYILCFPLHAAQCPSKIKGIIRNHLLLKTAP